MNFQELWRSFYGEQVPIAYLLREKIPHAWVRIHSLPESKRYAENESETEEILRRHNCVANAVLGENAECVFFFPDYALNKRASFFEALKGEPILRLIEPEVTMWAAATVWQEHKFDALLRLRADDEVCYLSWMNARSGEIFAPYDGGADLFLSSIARRGGLRRRFKTWLPQNRQGV